MLMFELFAVPEWLITRSLARCKELLNSDSERYGIKHHPLVDIEFTNVIPDTLHLLLRIRGKLLNQVINTDNDYTVFIWVVLKTVLTSLLNT